HGFLRRIDHLQVWRKILELERNAQTAIHGRDLGRDHHPEQNGERQRHHFQAEMRKGVGPHQSPLSMRTFNRAVRRAASTGPSNLPSRAIEMLPVSSDTMMATASFSSVR